MRWGTMRKPASCNRICDCCFYSLAVDTKRDWRGQSRKTLRKGRPSCARNLQESSKVVTSVTYQVWGRIRCPVCGQFELGTQSEGSLNVASLQQESGATRDQATGDNDRFPNQARCK